MTEKEHFEAVPCVSNAPAASLAMKVVDLQTSPSNGGSRWHVARRSPRRRTSTTMDSSRLVPLLHTANPMSFDFCGNTIVSVLHYRTGKLKIIRKGEAHIGSKNTLTPVSWEYFRPRRVRIWGRFRSQWRCSRRAKAGFRLKSGFGA